MNVMILYTTIPFLTAQRVGCPTLVSRSTARARSDSTSAPWHSTRHQLDHQLADSPPNAFDTSLLSGASSYASNSIRIFARISSMSTGSQHNATSRRSLYNINYHKVQLLLHICPFMIVKPF
jgi:hypothetical protein